MTAPLIEVCVEGIDGFLAAQGAGADRVELCASLMEGGLTPSLATIRAAVRAARIPVHVIVRPRGGDFLYSQAEFETMLADVAALRSEGVAGVVIGCLTPDGRIDEARMQALVEAARPMSVTCHRAFDMTADAGEALEALIRCGVDRVLTSGQRDTALEGLDILKQINAQAGDRIVIMGCGALDADTIKAVRDGARLRELHFAALKTIPSGMMFRNPNVGMGGTGKDREYQLTVTDPDAVRATIAAARSA
ncbi:copper homeostasis protein CutC [Mycoplana dimorpha]|uniref:PF03932 family protein CutC n=1 Tax=Mycoplana dimorpha TaxID=28320 RepID=A0A2T5AZ65_MYCDI|nr:copper homeostasis protein CutC [Mycoplana dimorpha]PTM92027.1 copper homeostasis protein CutC [Mycoplana dimorpha]